MVFIRVPVLRLENPDARRIVCILIAPVQRFSIEHLNSIYDAPVTEEFEASDGAVRLLGVRTQSPAVMEYYGFEDAACFHRVERPLGTLRFRARMGPPQRLLIKGETVSFGDLADPGEPLELSLGSMPLGIHLWTHLAAAWRTSATHRR